MREDNAGSLGLCPKPRGIGQTLTTLGCRISNAVQAEEPMTANLNHQHDDGVRGVSIGTPSHTFVAKVLSYFWPLLVHPMGTTSIRTQKNNQRQIF